MGRYNTYTPEQNAAVFHHFLGTIILMGCMTLLLGFLLLHSEIILLGSGMVVLAGAASVCDMSSPRHVDAYYGRTQDELEFGPASE
jgi:hypothetical protein